MTDNTVLPSILFIYSITFYFSQQKRFEDTVNINYRLPIKVYYRICTLTRIYVFPIIRTYLLMLEHSDKNVISLEMLYIPL